MVIIIGDHTGTTFDDFLILPGLHKERTTPDSLRLRSEIRGIELRAPFFTAAMRSITGKRLALAAGKAGIMAVAPRGLTPEKEAEIVRYVKDHEVKPGNIESVKEPVTIFDNETLGDGLEKTKEHGHSNIPVVTKKMDFVGMFTYNSSEHDQMNPHIPITQVMKPFKDAKGSVLMDVCNEGMSDEEIKNALKEKGYRFIPVLDSNGKLSRLVFIQKEEAYKVGAAIDTHDGWEIRARMLVEAGVDMIFIDTSDAHKEFSRNVVTEYKKMFPQGPPICAGNIVTSEAFEYLADAGADIIKVGMGPGSTCTTNEVLGVGSPQFWALVEICKKRDEYYKQTDRYVPVIVDGGISNTGDIAVALTHADGVMGGKIFGCFDESAGEKIIRHGKTVAVRIYGEASKESYETTGNMKRYDSPLNQNTVSSFQGVSGLNPYRGRFKPGLEVYEKTIKEVLYHTGCRNLKEFREKAIIIRLSERAKTIAKPHSIEIVND